MDRKASSLDDIAAGIRRGVAEAVREAHASGLPVSEADDTTIYAIYPDGRRVAVKHLPIAPGRASSKAA